MLEFEELLQYDENSPVKIDIKLDKHSVIRELKPLMKSNFTPISNENLLKSMGFFTLYNIGNHQVNILREKCDEETKYKHYVGLFYLMHNRDFEPLECSMHIDAISRFLCFKLGLMLTVFDSAKRMRDTKDLQKYEEMNRELKKYNNVDIQYYIKDDDDFNNKCIILGEPTDVKPISNVTYKNLHVHTDLFGTLRAPTAGEMKEFLKKEVF